MSLELEVRSDELEVYHTSGLSQKIRVQPKAASPATPHSRSSNSSLPLQDTMGTARTASVPEVVNLVMNIDLSTAFSLLAAGLAVKGVMGEVNQTADELKKLGKLVTSTHTAFKKLFGKFKEQKEEGTDVLATRESFLGVALNSEELDAKALVEAVDSLNRKIKGLESDSFTFDETSKTAIQELLASANKLKDGENEIVLDFATLALTGRLIDKLSTDEDQKKYSDVFSEISRVLGEDPENRAKIVRPGPDVTQTTSGSTTSAYPPPSPQTDLTPGQELGVSLPGTEE